MATALLAGISSAVHSRRTERLGSKRVVDSDPDPDESELRSFEKNCQMLNTRQYSGVRRLQGL